MRQQVTRLCFARLIVAPALVIACGGFVAPSIAMTQDVAAQDGAQSQADEINVINTETLQAFAAGRNYSHALVARFRRVTAEPPGTGFVPQSEQWRLGRGGFSYWEYNDVPRFSRDDGMAFLEMAKELGIDEDADDPMIRFAQAYRNGRIEFVPYFVVNGGETPAGISAPGSGRDKPFVLHMRYYSKEPISPKEAREVVQAFQEFVQRGTCDIAKKLTDDYAASRGSQLEDYREKLAAAEEQYEAATKEFEDLSYREQREQLTREAVSEYTEQLRDLRISIAGEKAKVERCTALLTARNNDTTIVFDEGQKEITRTIETLKVNAEIELAGLSAKAAEIEAILRPDELGKLRGSLFQDIRNHRGQVESCENAAAYAEEVKARLVPPELIDNEVRLIQLGYSGGSGAP